jgi:hypothetical protein
MQMGQTANEFAAKIDRLAARRPIFVYNLSSPEFTASIRVSAVIPAHHLGARVLFFGPGMDAEDFLERNAPEVVILTKAYDDSFRSLAIAARRRGIKVVTSLCDFYFKGIPGERNRILAELSDVVVAQTVTMRENIKQYFGRETVLIEESIEYPRIAPKFAPGNPIRLIWYGHSFNHNTLMIGLKSIADCFMPLSLMILSDQAPDFSALQRIAPKVSLNFFPWSMNAQHNFLGLSDMVFLPSQDDESTRAKGHNRLVEAINGGRIAIAHPLPQYQELADYCLCDADYAKSIERAVKDPASMLGRIAAGQEYIDTRFAPEVVAGKWRDLILSL